MENVEIIQKLSDLYQKALKFENLQEESNKKYKELENARKQCPMRVANFDRNMKEKYISSKIGHKPKKPTGIVKFAVPVYLAKKKEYEEKVEVYKKQYSYYQKKYYEVFAEQRKKLEEEERAEIEHRLQVATTEYDSVKTELDAAKKALDMDKTLGPKLKKTSSISSLIEYFQDQRVESIKEAANLYYEEQHRLKLENYAREQKKIIEKVVESVEEAVEKAESASQRADEAYDLAQIAMDRADEAYEMADTSEESV